MKPKIVKFKRGFKKKTNSEVIQLLNKTIDKSNRIKNESFVKLVKQFKLISEPSDELDWLAQYNEPGQTCEEFFSTAPFDSPNDLGTKTFIYYIQIGDFNRLKLDFKDLIEYSKCFFSEKSIKLMPLKVDIIIKQDKGNNNFELKAQYGDKSTRITHRYDTQSNNYQILAQSLFGLLKRIKPKDAHCLIGFSEIDFYADSTDLFVAGLCHGNQYVGAFSCFRYNPTLKFSEEFWWDYKTKNVKKNETNLLLTRSCKLLVHETCHLLGIDHCVFMDCCMNGSGHLKEDFRQAMFLCPIDLKKLAYLIQFDPVERYKKLQNFFKRIKSINELKWLTKTISILKNE